MGDRCTVSIKFGGTITRAQAEKLVELLADYDFSADYVGGPASSIENLDEDHYAEEVNYANISSVTDWCVEQDIAYEKWNGAGGEYGEMLERFTGSGFMTASCADGEPLVSMCEILKAETLASCLADVIAKARFMCGPFPNLKIEGE